MFKKKYFVCSYVAYIFQIKFYIICNWVLQKGNLHTAYRNNKKLKKNGQYNKIILK